VIEHNLDVIKNADWVIDMGPEGGFRGGTVVAEGTPEQIAKAGGSYTGQYLAQILKKSTSKAGWKWQILLNIGQLIFQNFQVYIDLKQKMKKLFM